MVIILAVALYVYSVAGASGVIELTKEEALQLQNLQFRALASQGDLNDFVGILVVKYGVSMETHNLELETGRFVPIAVVESPTEEQNEK